VPPARTTAPGTPGSAEAVAPDALPDAAASLARGSPGAETPTDMANAGQQAGDILAEPALQESIAPDVAPDQASGAAADASVDDATVAAAESLAEAINRSVEGTLGAEASPNLSVTVAAEGVLINLTDDADFSMFGVGSAIPDAKVVILIEDIARALAAQPGDVVIRGFTDGRPFRNDAYDNWRLSAARAHMAHYMLTRGGLDEQRVVAIEGHADRDLRNPADSYAAENRRIEILLKAADQ
jgi:chemotaxis protein MotB